MNATILAQAIARAKLAVSCPGCALDISTPLHHLQALAQHKVHGDKSTMFVLEPKAERCKYTSKYDVVLAILE